MEILEPKTPGWLCIRKPIPGMARGVYGQCHEHFVESYFKQYPGELPMLQYFVGEKPWHFCQIQVLCGLIFAIYCGEFCDLLPFIGYYTAALYSRLLHELTQHWLCNFPLKWALQSEELLLCYHPNLFTFLPFGYHVPCYIFNVFITVRPLTYRFWGEGWGEGGGGE